MTYQKHCPGCFRRKDAQAICPHCGYDEAVPRSPLFLQHGVMLAGQYRVGKVLGRPGGFGITYLGWDVYLQQRVAIKEFLPPDIAARIPESQDITVHTTQDRQGFEQGKEQFLREARIVARLDHPNIVRVRGFFNANDTAYMVMDYYDGMSLDAYFAQVKPTLDAPVACSLMQMILDGLAYVHQHGVVHRDVKPHNIYLAAIGKPILLDFGAARKAQGVKQQSISVVLTEGYAPLEQYQRHGSQGPWTDVYGVAATLYRMIVGRSPPIALDRISRDQLEIENYPGISEPVKPVMRKALALKIEDRYQSAEEFKAALVAVAPAAAAAEPPPSFNPLSSVVVTGASAHSAIDLLPATTRRDPPPVMTPTPAAADVTTPTVPFHPRVAPPAPVKTGTAEPAPKREPASHAQPQAPLTHSPTAPRSAWMRWALPAGVLAAAVGVVLFWKPETMRPEPPAAAPATAAVEVSSAAEEAPAPPSAADPQAALENFSSEGQPPLSPDAIPNMVEIPAGGTQAGFRLSDAEITVGKFRTFTERTGYRNPAWENYPCDGTSKGTANWDNPGYAQTESHPVVCVNWNDARRYALWLSAETGRRFRLPTDSEWRYAAAAGTTTRYWWGDQIKDAYAVCGDCGRQNPSKPWIVATLGKNPWGLFGTASNVREWTCSTTADDSCAARNDANPASLRGGSWHDPTVALASGFRSSLEKTRRNIWTGFRIAEEADNRS